MAVAVKGGPTGGSSIGEKPLSGALTPPASSSTPVPPANSTSTTGTGPACVEEEIPQKLRVYEKIKKVETWEECRDACNADTQCAYFRWKVS